MVESIYFLKPAWCGNHLAGLWPETGLQPVNKSHRLQAVVCHFGDYHSMAWMPDGEAAAVVAALHASIWKFTRERH
jgi:hypothetical protein